MGLGPQLPADNKQLCAHTRPHAAQLTPATRPEHRQHASQAGAPHQALHRWDHSRHPDVLHEKHLGTAFAITHVDTLVHRLFLTEEQKQQGDWFTRTVQGLASRFFTAAKGAAMTPRHVTAAPWPVSPWDLRPRTAQGLHRQPQYMRDVGICPPSLGTGPHRPFQGQTV